MAYPRKDNLFATVQAIAQQYGIEAQSVERCDTLYQRGAALRVRSDAGDILIKPFRGSERQLEQLASTLEQLSGAGFDRMPAWLRTKRGRWWLPFNGRCYYATRWIEGARISCKPQDSYGLGETLATLHTTSRALQVLPVSTKQVIARLRRQHTLFTRLVRCIDKASPVQRWFSQHRETCLKLADQAWRMLERAEIQAYLDEEGCDLGPTLIHGDVTRPNTIVTAEGTVYLIDFERMRSGVPWFEVVKALSNTTDFATASIDALLAGYESVRPLLPEERVLIAALHRLPREAWYVTFAAYRGRIPAMFTILERTWVNRLRAINHLDAWAEGGVSYACDEHHHSGS